MYAVVFTQGRLSVLKDQTETTEITETAETTEITETAEATKTAEATETAKEDPAAAAATEFPRIAIEPFPITPSGSLKFDPVFYLQQQCLAMQSIPAKNIIKDDYLSIFKGNRLPEYLQAILNFFCPKNNNPVFVQYLIGNNHDKIINELNKELNDNESLLVEYSDDIINFININKEHLCASIYMLYTQNIVYGNQPNVEQEKVEQDQNLDITLDYLSNNEVELTNEFKLLSPLICNDNEIPKIKIHQIKQNHSKENSGIKGTNLTGNKIAEITRFIPEDLSDEDKYTLLEITLVPAFELAIKTGKKSIVHISELESAFKDEPEKVLTFLEDKVLPLMQASNYQQNSTGEVVIQDPPKIGVTVEYSYEYVISCENGSQQTKSITLNGDLNSVIRELKEKYKPSLHLSP